MAKEDLNQQWYMFCPNEVLTIKGYCLEDYYGEEWEKRYLNCVKDPRLSKRSMTIKDIVRLVLKSAVETGTPFTFNRDTVNRANPNGHQGMIYCSNLCTEIAQNMSAIESVSTEVKTTEGDTVVVKTVRPGDFVVCNLASLSLGHLPLEDETLMKEKVATVVRALDNVIDLNFYPVPFAQVTNHRYRSIGLGVSGYHHDLAERTFYTQKLFGIMGVGLFVQVLFGHKMPVVIGPASVLLIGIITSQTSQLSDIYTAVICGGALLFLISYSPWMNFLKGIFTSRIVIVILALIAFTLTPTILGLLFTGQPQPFLVLCLSLGIVFIMLLGNKFLRGVWKSSIVLWGLIIGTVCYVLIFGVQGIAMANSDGVTDSGFLLSGLSFNPGIFLSFLFCYIALFINELGSVQSVGTAINVDHLDRRTKMGLRITGLMNILSGGMGVVGPVDYSMSPGVIMSTGCASRYTLLPAAGLLVLCAFFPGVVSMFAAIPRPVMGIILLYLMEKCKLL